MLPERFMARVDARDGHWCWTGGVARGRPSFYVGQRDGKNHYVPARRLAWEAERGPLPGDYVVFAECDEPRCVNPEHLRAVARDDFDWLGTHAGPHQVNAAKRLCNSGHPLEGKNLRIEPNGARRCRACLSARKREWRARKRAERA